MRRFVTAMLCLLLALFCAVALYGCASEKTGLVDWLKWYSNQESGLPVVRRQYYHRRELGSGDLF